MRLRKFLISELSSNYGKGITFFDIDETIFNTFAEIKVIDDKTGEEVESLSNQEYNTHKLKPGQHYDYREFKDAELFSKTSKPILPTIKRIKRMFKNIDIRGSKVVLLTARGTFPDMRTFLKRFKKEGIPIDNIDIEFAGDVKGSSVSSTKKKIIMKYVSSGEYRRVRLVDDDMANIRKFLSLKNEIPQDVIDKVKEKHNIPEGENFPVISFYGLLVKPNGSLKRVR